MDKAYFNLKYKLEELGYSNAFPLEAVPLVECILADLLQTTRSLQHYMDLSKQALMQRDKMVMEAEPYKCDNIKLIQENNKLHHENIALKEENLKLDKDSKRKIKSLTIEIKNKETLISKLQHDIRDLSLRGLCAETLSSRNKNKRKDKDESSLPKVCICSDNNLQNDSDSTKMRNLIQILQEKNEEYVDKITLLQEQIENRNTELLRLKILLEGGRPIKAVMKDFDSTSDHNTQKTSKQIKELEITIDDLRKEIEIGLEKQHEAMVRALTLADKNKNLQKELEKVDKLALKVEDDCNKRVNSMINEVTFLQTKIEDLISKNAELKKDLSQQCTKNSSSCKNKIEESLNLALQEKETLQKEIKDLVELNKSLQDKILSLSEVINNFHKKFTNEVENKESPKCTLKEEFKKLLQEERTKYEMYIKSMQEKLNDTMNLFNTRLQSKDKHFNTETNITPNNQYMRELHNKLCESEHKILLLKKENDELKTKVTSEDNIIKQKYQDIITHLNMENSELSKENILLSQQVSHYKGLEFIRHDRGDSSRRDTQTNNEKIDEMKNKIQLLQNDKMEYNLRYKEAIKSVDNLRKDLFLKQKEIENLQEENCSYKMTNRTGKASIDLVKDECNMLKEQLKNIQNDFVKEKSLANQFRNIQIETERNSAELQSNLLHIQKKLSISNDTIEALEKKNKELQAEILSLKKGNSDLFENIKMLDKERDTLIIDLDSKTENISMLEQKLKSQTYEINKLENEIRDLNRKLNMNKISEHKVQDYESQITFLNGEILRLSQQYDTAIIENKHLQNSLADTNGVLKLTKIELEKSRKDVDTLKQQLQHYVAEIRRIEELLSQKETERSDMLEQFASLSVEANILENTNHSLENESASKTLQLQSYVSKVQSFEEKLADKDNIIDSQSARIAAMTCKIATLENEIKLINEEKFILKQNNTCLKQMCNNFQESQFTKTNNFDESELKISEQRIKNLTNSKTKLQAEKEQLENKLITLEKLLSNARREIVELKLTLQDATTETESLHRIVNRKHTQHSDVHETLSLHEELDLPLIPEDRLEELSNEEKYESHQFEDDINTNSSHYKHGSTI